MVGWVCGGLVEEADWLALQRQKLALEAKIPYSGDFFLTVAPVVFEKDCDRRSGVPVGAVQWYFEDLRCARHRLRNLDFLCGCQICCRREIEIIAIFEQFDRAWRGRRWRSIYEQRMQFYLAGKSRVCHPVVVHFVSYILGVILLQHCQRRATEIQSMKHGENEEMRTE